MVYQLLNRGPQVVKFNNVNSDQEKLGFGIPVVGPILFNIRRQHFLSTITWPNYFASRRCGTNNKRNDLGNGKIKSDRRYKYAQDIK